MKVADVNLFWTRSVSDDVASQRIVVNLDGTETVNSELPPELESFQLEVKASSSVVFTVYTTDTEGNEVASESYTFRLGNLDLPQPATNLGHEVTGVREVPDEPIPEPI